MIPCKWKPVQTEPAGTVYRCTRHHGRCGPILGPPNGIKCDSTLYHSGPHTPSETPIPRGRTAQAAVCRHINATCLIVTFLRPRKLLRLVASIRRYYPFLPIVIADNGRRLPDRPEKLAYKVRGSETWVLPFDCGLAASRNFLVSNTQGDVLILDDDFELTKATDLERLRIVLDERPDVGIACGHAGFVDPQRIRSYQRTQRGVRYCLCDLADNFMLIRREVLNVVRWNDALKISGEHGPFFEAVGKTKWKVAYVPSVKVKHNQGGDSDEYKHFRNRSFR